MTSYITDDLYRKERDAHLALGEYCLIKAPVVSLPNGRSCVPQHFYGYNHSLESVEYLLRQVDFSPNYPLFCAEDDMGLFIQVGVIGRENYQKSRLDRPRKIVYGRKWRVEPNLPTSEIVQSIFLALKKAREHEIRELLTLKSADGQYTSTPFNNHHDLPLMAQCRELFQSPSPSLGMDLTALQGLCQRLRFNRTPIECHDLVQRKQNQYWVDIAFPIAHHQEDQSDFPELQGVECTLVLSEVSHNSLLYALMDKLIELSDRYVEEHFRFNGFARFSRQHCIEAIGAFSVQTRRLHDNAIDEIGKQLISEHNCSVDASRAPCVSLPLQRQRLNQSFQGLGQLEGFLPVGL